LLKYSDIGVSHWINIINVRDSRYPLENSVFIFLQGGLARLELAWETHGRTPKRGSIFASVSLVND